VTGSKGSGKSAFARLLVNTLLSQGHRVVAYLDLDPGQPEFTPPVSAS
jgi:polynucleotide 5'-hydroxyl-kinase GRC3/NOL9